MKIFRETKDFVYTFNHSMSIYLGLPFYYLTLSHLIEIIKVIKETNLVLSKASKSSFNKIDLSFVDWFLNLDGFLQILKENKFNSYERIDQSSNYSKIVERETAYLDFLQVPFLSDFNVSFIKFKESTPLKIKTVDVEILSDLTIVKFNEFLMPESKAKNPKILNQVFEKINSISLNDTRGVYICADIKNDHTAVYNLVENTSPDFYIDNNIRYYRIEKLKKDKITSLIDGKYGLLFIKISDNIIFPYLCNPKEEFINIRGALSNILRNFGINQKKDYVLNYFKFRG